jgi:hypothetical protein
MAESSFVSRRRFLGQAGALMAAGLSADHLLADTEIKVPTTNELIRTRAAEGMEDGRAADL